MQRVSSRTARRTLLAAAVLLCGCAQVFDMGLAKVPGPVDLGTDLSSGPVLDFSSKPTDAAASTPADLATGCDVHAIKVNELQTAGTGGASDEFVELYNPCPTTVAMKDAVIVYRSATSSTDAFSFWTFTAETIAAKARFVVANTNYAGTSDAKPFTTGGMAATGGSVALKLGAVVIDAVGWGTATNAYVETTAVGAPASGQSAARKPDGTDTGNNAVDFVLGPASPGAAN